MFKFSVEPSLEQLRIDHVKFNYEKMKWDAYQTPRSLILALFGELGELISDVADRIEEFSVAKPCIKLDKTNNRKTSKHGSKAIEENENAYDDIDNQKYTGVLSELIDVFSYLICIAYECGVDIAQPDVLYTSKKKTFSNVSWDELEVLGFYYVEIKADAPLVRNLYKLVVSASNICDYVQWKVIDKNMENLNDERKQQVDKVIKNIFCNIVAISSRYNLDIPRLLAEKNDLTSDKYSSSIGKLSKEDVFYKRYSDLKTFRKKASTTSADYEIKQSSSVQKVANVHKLLCSLITSAGLISEIFQWDEEIHEIILSDPKQAHLSKQLSKTIDCLIKIAQYYNFHLGNCFSKKMQKNVLKYPISLAKNSADKYCDLSNGNSEDNSRGDDEKDPLPLEISTISQAKDLMTSFTNDRNWAQYHTPRCLAIALFGEVGEVVELFANSDDPKLECLQEELSDCLAYSIELVTVTDIDICAALHHYFPEA